MSDQPMLNVAGVCFQVTLQCQYMAVDAERLVVTNCRTGQSSGTVGDVKAVTMPMQHWYTTQCCQRGCFTFRSQRQRREPDFLHAHTGDTSTQRAGNQLRAQTDAE